MPMGTLIQKILGQPERVDGGTIGFWRYPNGGTLTFVIGKLNSWSEPGAMNLRADQRNP